MAKKEMDQTRRDFLKTAGIAGVAATVSTMLPGCGNTDTGTGTGTGTSTPLTAALAANQTWAFETPPAPISVSSIANTVTADIIVVGAGTAGLVCANSAAENGAKVVLITASSINIGRGGSNHAINSKAMKAANFTLPDTGIFLRQQLCETGYNANQSLWWKFARESPGAMDWLIDKMEAAGYQTVFELGTVEPNNGPMNMPAGSHSWIGGGITAPGQGQQLVVDTLAKTAAASGVTIVYKMTAKQLVRENNNTGRVTAVIAQDANGNYNKYVGTKAIVLATGDFSANLDMMTKYCPQALSALNTSPPKTGYDTERAYGGLYPGDGQRMGLWIGAAWQKNIPNAAMGVCFGAGPSPQAMSCHQGLLLDRNGKRYSNEDFTFAYMGRAQLALPGGTNYAIWGTNYATDAAPWYVSGDFQGSAPTSPSTILSGWEKSVAAGTMFKADTIAGVISALGMSTAVAATANATIARYNTLCANGVDTDFFKRPALLVPISTGPFYGQSATVKKPYFHTVCGGLRTDTDLHVCDANDNPIPGLFNIGIMVGDYFTNMYTFIIEGNNLGANCVTFGYTVGRDIATGATP